MTTTADLQARAIRKREQTGYAVPTQPGHGSIVTNANGHTIATLTSLDKLRALVDQLYELVTP